MGALISNSFLPVDTSKARKRSSAVAPINTTPPAVVIAPPAKGVPHSNPMGNGLNLSILPKGVYHKISPLIISTATIKDHGGAVQGENNGDNTAFCSRP